MWIVAMCSIIAGVVLLDQVSKILIVEYLYEGQVTVIPRILQFSYVENRGMAFGLLADKRWVFLVFSTLGIVVLGFYLFRYAKTTLCRVALALIVGGGIGNMIDRIFRGFVVDFIDFCAFPELWYWVFNIADAAVSVGGVLFAVSLIFEVIEEYKEDQKKAAEAEASKKAEALQAPEAKEPVLPSGDGAKQDTPEQETDTKTTDSEGGTV